MLQKISRSKIPIIRIITQASFAFFCSYAGWRFYLFYLWGTGKSEYYIPRPPSVEAFLPIGALLSLKRLVLTGIYDSVHPAGLTIFLAALTIAFFARKGFCGWICPIGFLSNLTEKSGKRFKLLISLPTWLDWPLLALKYLLLGFFVYLIVLKMDIRGIEGFITSPYNITVDARMLLFFLNPSTLALSIIIFLLSVSFFIRNFWCRYLCPYGALLGLLAFFSPIQVQRRPENCIDCKKCEKICPGSIKITQKEIISLPECIGCLECVALCPPEDCLTLTVTGRKKINTFILPIISISLFLGFWLTALSTNHWYSKIHPDTVKRYYQMTLAQPKNR